MAEPAPSPIPLSILMRTFNEADRVEAALVAAHQLGGELVVIDSGSKDDTVAICERNGARVIHNPWPGFGPQRNFGEEQVGHDMILSLDADEIVTPEFAAEVRELFAKANTPRLMIVKKAFVFPHAARPPPLWWATTQVLIYDRRIARTTSNPNTDTLQITASDKPVTIGAPLWHFTYRDWKHAITKGVYVADLAATTRAKNRPTASLVIRLFTEFPVSFIKFYVGRRYFLGGLDGFSMAMVSAVSRWLRIAMMLEQARGQKRS